MITKDQIGYYSQWYHSVIRSIIGIQSIKKDFEQIASMVIPPITPEQAKKSIKLLLDLNMITVGEDGSYQLVKNIVNTGKDIPQNIKDNAHIKFTGLAQNAIKTMPPQSRYAISHTVGISEKTYREITKEIESFRATVRGLIDKDTDPSRVYQLEILMFPLSSDIIED